jgi:hypothetical protein
MMKDRPVIQSKMRNRISCKAVLVGACLLLSGALRAGSDSVGFMPRTHLVKVGLTSALVRTVGLNYERVLDPRRSVGLTVAWMVPGRPMRLLDLATTRLAIGGDRSMSGLYITPEMKWFVERSDARPAPRGLYVGAYARYGHTRYDASVTGAIGTDGSTGSFTGSLRIRADEYGVGAMLGYQFLAVGDRLAVDLLFLAPRWAYTRIGVDADLGGDGMLFDDLAQALEDRLGREVAPLNIELSTAGRTTLGRNGMGMRAGIRIGYAF